MDQNADFAEMTQLGLFEPHIIKSADLISFDSPRKAFYKLWIEMFLGKYTVRKESGGWGKVFDRRLWEFGSLDEAEKYFDRWVGEKIDPDRRSQRKYCVV